MRKPFPPVRIDVRLAALLVVAAWLTCAADAQANGPAKPRSEVKNVFWQPNDVKQGSPVLITVEVCGPAREVNGTWLGKHVRFWHSEKPQRLGRAARYRSRPAAGQL